MPILQQILLIVCATLSDPVLLNAARIRAGAFTRNNGKLPFWTMMELLMVNRKNTITSSMAAFFKKKRLAEGGSPEDTVKVSQQAFSKARAGIDHTLFKECHERVLDFYAVRNHCLTKSDSLVNMGITLLQLMDQEFLYLIEKYF
jgi:hypothetical protein